MVETRMIRADLIQVFKILNNIDRVNKQLPYDQRWALNLWTLEERRVRADLIEVYKIINGLPTVCRAVSFFLRAGHQYSN